MHHPFVSVIIPFYGESAELLACLAALRAQTYPGSKFEVVVIDNDSSAGLDDVVNGGGNVRVLFEQRSGSYAARNKGLGECKGEIVAFTDADCIPNDEWIERGVARLMQNDDGCQLVGGRVELSFRKPGYPSTIELYDWLRNFKQKDAVLKEGYSVTANLVTYKTLFDDIGKFNEEWMSRGDKEWCQRAVCRGYPICYDESVVVRHPARGSFGEILAKTRRVAGGVFKEDSQTRGMVGRYVSQLFLGVLPPVGRIRLLVGEEVTKGKRVNLFLLMWLMKLVHLSEYTRLLLGGRARR